MRTQFDRRPAARRRRAGRRRCGPFLCYDINDYDYYQHRTKKPRRDKRRNYTYPHFHFNNYPDTNTHSNFNNTRNDR